jgi:Tfp pilus assembly protein PilO
MIKNILTFCTIEDENTFIKKIDFSLKEFAYEITMVSQYGNINIDVEDLIELYDELKEHEVISLIITQIPESEIKFIDSVLNREIEQSLKLDNSLETIVANALNKFISQLPSDKELSKMLKSIPKEINRINPDSLKFLSDAINYNNGKTK